MSAVQTAGGAGYVERAITVIFTVGPKTDQNQTPVVFPGGGNTLTLEGYQVSAQVTMAGGQSCAEAEIAIYGVRQQDMNALASIGNLAFASNNNMVTVLAGDAVNGMPQVFRGNITNAYADYSQAPNVSFNVSALDGSSLVYVKLPAASYPGRTDVSVIMADLASKAGLTLENSGVSVLLTNSYLPGGVLDQIRRCARAAGINYYIDRSVLAIWPKDGARISDAIPVISPSSGLVGYPTFSNTWVNFTSLFNPALLFGGKVKVESSLPQACGTWVISSMVHSLESQIPNGDWFSAVETWGLEAFQAATGTAAP